MPLSQVEQLVTEIASFGPGQEAYLFNYGEPLLHPNITTIVERMSARGIRTKISTNATNLSRVGPAIIRAGLSILLIDLDGVTQDAHGTYRVGSDVSVVMDEIRGFMATSEAHEGRTQIILQTLVHNRNLSQRDELRNFARSVGIRYLAWKNLALDLGERLDPVAFAAAQKRLIPVGTEFDRYTRLIRNSNALCLFAEMNGVVLSNGDYVVCTHDADATVVLGNVFITGYRRLRESAFESIREQIAQKRLAPCSSCSMSSNLGYIEELAEGKQLPGSINFSERGIQIGD